MALISQSTSKNMVAVSVVVCINEQETPSIVVVQNPEIMYSVTLSAPKNKNSKCEATVKMAIELANNRFT